MAKTLPFAIIEGVHWNVSSLPAVWFIGTSSDDIVVNLQPIFLLKSESFGPKYL